MKHKRMITLLLVLAMLLGILPVTAAAAEAPAGAVTVTSPDSAKAASISVWLDSSGVPYYQVSYNGSVMIEPSKLGLETSLGNFTSDLTMGTVTTSSGDSTWQPVVGEQAKYRDWYNAAFIPLTKGEKKLTLELRAYPEGVAFRYVLPQSETYYTVSSESTLFTFPAGTMASLHIGGHQTVPQKYAVENLPGSKTYYRPVTMQYTNGSLLTICEANLDNYCEMLLTKGSAACSIAAKMASNVTVSSGSPAASPWRTLVMGGAETELAAHNFIVMNLNEAPTGDFSWVKSSSCLRAASGMNTTAIKGIVDQAAREGIGYVLLDTGWYGPEYDTNCDPRLDPTKLDSNNTSDEILRTQYFDTKGGWKNTGEGVFNTRGKGFNVYAKLGTPGSFQTDVDIPAICTYANSKNVGIILYVNGKFFPDASGRNRFTTDELFDYFEKWGVKGVKPGFVNVATQKNEKFMQDVIDSAARHKLILTVHDEWVPTGLERTHPNLFCTEGILGDEGIGRKSDGQIPQDIATLFTRPIQGPTDHTFCYPGKATKAYALASAMMFRTGMSVLYWYTNPDAVKSQTGDVLKFWQNLPCNWDKTLYLEGSMYEYATYARKAKGTDDWYIGSLSAIDRTLQLPLTFLDADTKYAAEIWADGADADGYGGSNKNRNKQTLEEAEYIVDSTTVLTRELQYGFGYAVRLKKATAEQISTLPAYSADHEALKAKINKGKQYKADGYTTDSFAALQTAIQNAEKLDASASAEDMKQAGEDIDAAIAGLKNAGALTAAIAKAGRLTSYHYTEETWKTLTDAVAEGEALLKTSFTQAQVDAAAKKIVDAIAALVEDSRSTVGNTTYLSDLRYTKTDDGTNNIQKDKNRVGGKMALMVEGTRTEFQKGMAFDAPGGLYYDLTGKGFDVFEAYVGVDAEKQTQGDIIFRVYGDGVLLYESKPSGHGSENAQHFSIPVAGVKELYLQGDMNGSKDGDWADWADAKFLTWKNPNRALSGITVDGMALRFDPDVTEYFCVVSSDGHIPQVEAVCEAGATAIVTQAKAQPGRATIVATSAAGEVETYTVTFCETEPSDYLCEKLNLRSGNTMYSSSCHKDGNHNGDQIGLYGEDGTSKVTYAHGIGTHANASTDSSLTFNIEGQGYDRFESWVGVDYDKASADGRTNVTFRIYVDEELVYDSGVCKKGTSQKFASVDVRGAKTLRLQVDANKDQSADWANWADAKFLKYKDAEANLTGITVNGTALDFDRATKDYYWEVSAADSIPVVAETHDEGATVAVTQATTKYGAATINVTTGFGEQETYTVHFGTMALSNYLSDLPSSRLIEKTTHAGSAVKDKNYGGGTITTYNDNATSKVEYAKGVGTHANASNKYSSLVYDLDGLDVQRFESWVGVDYTKVETDSDGARHRSNVIFRIYLDGSDMPVWTSRVSQYQTPREFVSIDVTGVKTLRLQADPNGRQDADWSNWADAKFLSFVDLSALEALYNAHQGDTQGEYSDATWSKVESALGNAARILLDPTGKTQTEVDAAKTALKNAIDGLQEAVDWTALDAAIVDATAKNHPETYCKNELKTMQDALAAAEALRKNPDATRQKAADALAALTTATGALQEHTPDRAEPTETEPVKCSNCGYIIASATGHIHHTTTQVPAETATCISKGQKAYYTCSGCSNWFEDAEATTVIPDHSTVETDYDPTNHVGGTEVLNAKDATYTEEGYTGDTCCKSCHAVITQGQVIPKLTPAPTPVIPVTPSEPAQLPFNPNAGANTTKFPFADVPSDSWYYSSVKAAWENGLIDGVTANEFKPNATLTVAQTIKLAAALHQLDRTGEVSLTSGGANWYDSYVNYAVTNGIIEKDYANYTQAQMNAPVTRGEFVHIFHGAEEAYKAINTVADNAIPDVKATDKFAAEIYEFYRAGILTGSDAKGTFHSASTIKRSEAAAILLRMFEASARKSIILN